MLGGICSRSAPSTRSQPTGRCMKPEHDERFRRIADDYLDRPGGDYAELLRRGEVSSPEGVDPELWRAEIRAKARADKIRVITIRSGDRAIAAAAANGPEGSGVRGALGGDAARRGAAGCCRAGTAVGARDRSLGRARPGEHRDVPALPGPDLCPARHRSSGRGWRGARGVLPGPADRAHRLSRNASSLSEGL